MHLVQRRIGPATSAISRSSGRGPRAARRPQEGRAAPAERSTPSWRRRHDRAPDSELRHLTQAELAERWQVSERTLDRWRANGKGPAWMKLNGRVRYRVEDVLAFERVRLRRS